ncbi:MAG: transcription antitermination factor NusB [Ignavibacteriaceae bacterium]|jgi:N utilization substance protein B
MSQVFKRRVVREKALQILYAYNLNKDSLDSLIGVMTSDINDKTDKEFANDLVNRVLAHKDELDKHIKFRVDNWEMNRIALIDKILLRMGICELLYFPDIPPKVSINEAIEIAKLYSTAGSGKFINGILDVILTELKDTGKLNKTGRGLLEESISKPSAKK